MEEYITLTPFGDHKQYALKPFLEGLDDLEPKPARKVFCLDLDTQCKDEFNNYTVLYSPAIFCYTSSLERICSAREILRNYFIYSNYDWALWIDSDIVLPSDAPQKLFDEAYKNNCIVVSNYYPASDHSERKWSGSGIMLTHKLACTGSHFWVADFNGKHLSEDYVFLSILEYGKPFVKMYTGKNVRVIGEFVKVKHILKEREI